MTSLDLLPNPAMRSGWLTSTGISTTAPPAHTDDIHAAIINNPDIEVITPAGGERRKPNTIAVTDILKLKAQIQMSFPTFFKTDVKGSASK